MPPLQIDSGLNTNEQAILISICSLTVEVPDIDYDKLAKLIGRKNDKHIKGVAKKVFEKVRASYSYINDGTGTDVDDNSDDQAIAVVKKKPAVGKVTKKSNAPKTAVKSAVPKAPAVKKTSRGKAPIKKVTDEDEDVADDVAGVNAVVDKAPAKNSLKRTPLPSSPPKRASRGNKTAEKDTTDVEAAAPEVAKPKGRPAPKVRITQAKVTSAKGTKKTTASEAGDAPDMPTDAESVKSHKTVDTEIVTGPKMHIFKT